MASIVEQPWRPVSGPSPSSPKNVHCLSGGVENVDNKRQNLGKPLSPPRSSSPTGPPATDVDSDSSEGSIPNSPPRPTSSSTTGSNAGLDTTKRRTGSFSNSFSSAILPPVGDSTAPKAQVRQHHGIERDWNNTHDSPRDLLSNPPSPKHIGGSRDNIAADNNLRRITLPSLDIPQYRTHSGTQALAHNVRSLELTPSLRVSSNSISDGVRRASSGSERTGWLASPPTSMPPPPLPSQSCPPQSDPFPRIAERTSGVPRANPLSVSELIHREAASTEQLRKLTKDQIPSLASEFIDVLKIRERVSEVNMPRFLDELNHQLSLNGLLCEAREIICTSFDLPDRQRSNFSQQTRSMLTADSEPARDMRKVIARAVVGLSRRELDGFEHEVGHMLDGSLHKPTSPYRESICCASYAARFPEDQRTELRRQLRRTPMEAFQAQQQPSQNSAAGSGQQQRRVHNLPPPREYEKLVDLRRGNAGPTKARKDPARPTNYSLREFPIFTTH